MLSHIIVLGSKVWCTIITGGGEPTHSRYITSCRIYVFKQSLGRIVALPVHHPLSGLRWTPLYY